MGGGLIDWLLDGVKATYVALHESFAWVEEDVEFYGSLPKSLRRA